MQWGRSQLATDRVNICSFRNEILNNLSAIVYSRPMQQSHCLRIRLIYIGTSIDKLRNTFQSSVLRKKFIKILSFLGVKKKKTSFVTCVALTISKELQSCGAGLGASWWWQVPSSGSPVFSPGQAARIGRAYIAKFLIKERSA